MARSRGVGSGGGGINNSILTGIGIDEVGKDVVEFLHHKNYSGPVVNQAANDRANIVDKAALLATLANKASTPDQIRNALVTLAQDQMQATPDMTAHQFRTMVSHFMNTDVPGGIDRSTKAAVKDFLKATEGKLGDAPIGQSLPAMTSVDDSVLKG